MAFTNEDFQLFALEFYYQNVAGRKTRSRKWQGPSNGFITDFKKRWGFTSKRPRMSHVAKNPNLQTQMVSFREECVKWIKHVGPSMFFNFDETFWRLLQNCLMCWGVKGNPTRLTTQTNAKTGMTLGFTIAADGATLPILLIGKGRTATSLRKFGVEAHKSRVVATTSIKGWSTTATMLFYLKEVLIPYTKGQLACLTWDTYGSHLDEKVVSYAHTNNIHIIPTPPEEPPKVLDIIFKY